MARNLEVHVGDALAETGARFVDAWHRAERGELTGANAEHHLSFEDFATFARLVTPKRLALLREVHRRPSLSARALAESLGRDVRRVQADVDALVGAGLLDRGPNGLSADYSSVRVETRIAL